MPHVHITPMRASRALALRFLATKFGLGMDAFTVRAWRASQAGFMCLGAFVVRSLQLYATASCIRTRLNACIEARWQVVRRARSDSCSGLCFQAPWLPCTCQNPMPCDSSCVYSKVHSTAVLVEDFINLEQGA